jgi:hypothetical protein
MEQIKSIIERVHSLFNSSNNENHKSNNRIVELYTIENIPCNISKSDSAKIRSQFKYSYGFEFSIMAEGHYYKINGELFTNQQNNRSILDNEMMISIINSLKTNGNPFINLDDKQILIFKIQKYPDLILESFYPKKRQNQVDLNKDNIHVIVRKKNASNKEPFTNIRNK